MEKTDKNRARLRLLALYLWYYFLPILTMLTALYTIIRRFPAPGQPIRHIGVIDLAMWILLILLTASAYMPLRKLSRRQKWGRWKTLIYATSWPTLFLVALFQSLASDLIYFFQKG